MNGFTRVVTIALSTIMCLIGLAMLLGLVSFWTNPSAETLKRFLPVAFFPFAWAAFVAFLSRQNRGQRAMAVLTIIVFVAFIGGVDFANGRQLYSSLSYFW